ncbi:ribulokinase [Aeromicrobium sp. NPDC092404]|uniref:ribulokinase n=1 Tax=Aeromicrobium sp. NPDC092404 TaxID=3154976 RepID=UPI00343D35A9
MSAHISPEEGPRLNQHAPVPGSPPSPVVVGVDFGTQSGRALVVRVSDGEELGSAVHRYAHGVLDRALPDGTPLGPDWALQVAADYLEVLQLAIPRALAEAGVDASAVIGVATDFTACTMIPTTEDGTPLSDVPGLAGEPHAYVKLWRHHAAQGQADRLNELARKRSEVWLPRYGGLISSEWEFAKGLQLLEEAPEVYARTAHFVEAADWIVWQLCGVLTRNACSAGYKGILQDGTYPSRDFLAELQPDFADFVTDKIDRPLVALGDRVGSLTEAAAALTGLPTGIAVAAGNVDAHVTAPAAQATGPGQMVLIMGTSTCHVMNSDVLREVPGMCGVVEGGVTPGMWGYEAGQSGVGDIFEWFTTQQVPAATRQAAEEAGLTVHEHLSRLAAQQAVGEHGLLALDWHSGNRSVLVDHDLTGLVIGLTLATRPGDVYRALLEATAFGTRLIIETFDEAGVPVEEIVVAGGLQKNPLLMQIYADVINLPLSTIGSDQGPALGSAIHAAVAAGAYPDIHAASAAMGRIDRDSYVPDPARAQAYDEIYADYRRLHDHFGRGGDDVMHRLKARRREVHR